MDPIIDQVETPPSLKTVAFYAIKDAVISEKLVPGPIYSEQTLAQKLGISKTPVHLALIDLASKGFVTILPRRGFRVTKLTRKNARDLFEFRIPMERTVIRNLTGKLTDIAFQTMDAILEELASVREPIRFQANDRLFHRYLASLTDNQYMVIALENIWDLCDWLGSKILSGEACFEEALREHLLVADMLKEHRISDAMDAMEAHLRVTERRVLPLLD